MHDPGPAPADATPLRHWPLFLAGIALFLVGPPLYVLQFRMKHLFVPWYVPILATAGVVLMVASLRRRKGVARALILALFLGLCSLEWLMLAVGMKSPAYTGPALPGQRLPSFTAILADGTPFTENDLASGTSTILLFFRGRW
jgi:hypothetical protein